MKFPSDAILRRRLQAAFLVESAISRRCVRPWSRVGVTAYVTMLNPYAAAAVEQEDDPSSFESPGNMVKRAIARHRLAAFEPRNRSNRYLRLFGEVVTRPSKPSPSGLTLPAIDDFVYHDVTVFVTDGIHPVKTGSELGIMPS